MESRTRRQNESERGELNMDGVNSDLPDESRWGGGTHGLTPGTHIHLLSLPVIL